MLDNQGWVKDGHLFIKGNHYTANNTQLSSVETINDLYETALTPLSSGSDVR